MSSLGLHINKRHLDLYNCLAKVYGWKPQDSGMSEAQSEASGDALQVRQQEFSKEVFHKHPLNFIIADDQVCLYLLCFLQPPRSCLLVLKTRNTKGP